jgi:hypothetical protein
MSLHCEMMLVFLDSTAIAITQRLAQLPTAHDHDDQDWSLVPGLGSPSPSTICQSLPGSPSTDTETTIGGGGWIKAAVSATSPGPADAACAADDGADADAAGDLDEAGADAAGFEIEDEELR